MKKKPSEHVIILEIEFHLVISPPFIIVLVNRCSKVGKQNIKYKQTNYSFEII